MLADEHADDGPDAEFGGQEMRAVLEKRLVRKIDTRMVILVVIYILNYVRKPSSQLHGRVNDATLQIDRNNAASVKSSVLARICLLWH